MNSAHLNYGANLSVPEPVKFKLDTTGGGCGNQEITKNTFNKWNYTNQKQT